MNTVLLIDEEMKELAIEYLETRRREIKLIEESLSKKDLSKIATIAHNMKGVAESYGFPELTRLGSEMERASIARDHDLTRKLLDDIRSYVATVELKFARIGAA